MTLSVCLTLYTCLTTWYIRRLLIRETTACLYIRRLENRLQNVMSRVRRTDDLQKELERELFEQSMKGVTHDRT